MHETKPVILVVDDSPDILILLRDILTLEGYPTRFAFNGKEALASVEAYRPAMIFLDLMMPEMDGFAFIEELQRREIVLPIVLITAGTHPTNMARAAQLEAEGVVQRTFVKPLRVMELLLEVDRLTAARDVV